MSSSNEIANKWREIARMDDVFKKHMVPSDLRVIIGEIDRLQNKLDKIEKPRTIWKA